MTTWPPARSVAGPLGLAVLIGLLGAAALAAGAAWQRQAAGFDPTVYFDALLALTLGLAAAFLAYHLASYRSLHYTLDENALTIHWGGLRQVIPLGRIREAVAVADLPPAERPPPARRGLRWPGLWLGTARTPDDLPLLAYASAPPAGQVLVRTPSLAYALSPAAPAAFLADLATRRAQGPAREVPQGTTTAGWLVHPLLSDRLALALVAGGLLLNLALFGYLAFTYPQLPDLLALHWNTQGDPDRIGAPTEVLRLPLIALGLWVVDLIGAGLVHRRERLAALFLYAGGAVVQVIFWAALLTIVLRALAGGAGP